MTLKEIVETRLAQLGLKPIKAAQDGGLGRDYIRDIISGKKTRVLDVTGLAEALALDPIALARNQLVPVQTDLKAPKPNASFPPRFQEFPQGSIPLRGQISAGANGRFIMNGQEMGRLFCPPMLEGVDEAYAVRIYGTSMEPRFFAGETAWINPREPIRKGDDVVVQLHSDDGDTLESYVKQFVSANSKTLNLFQWNPEAGEKNELEFDANRVASTHKIVFHAMV